MKTLNQKIVNLEKQVADLQSMLQELVDNVQVKFPKPLTLVGKTESLADVQAIDIKSGLGRGKGNAIIWNDTELANPINAEPVNPEEQDSVKSYNRHSHSRYNGGALIKDVLEIIEYAWGSITNKHSSQFWQAEPEIATEVNSSGETVPKVGQLELVFNPDTLKWGTAAFEIDIEKCYFVKRDSEGNIETDSKGNQKKALLYNSNQMHTSIIWDESGNGGSGCWRLLAAYSSGDE